MGTQNLASLLLQLLAGNTQPLLAAAAAGQASHPPAVLAAPPPQTLPPASIHPSPAPQPLAITQIQPYQSLQAAPSVLLPPLPPLSSSSASTNLSSVVNQARLSHSASSLPRQPPLTRRHPRTTAVAPPSLPRAPNISSCMTTVGVQPHLRTMNYIYTPQIGDSESDLYLMRFLKDTFLKTMREMGLVILQTSPVREMVIACYAITVGRIGVTLTIKLNKDERWWPGLRITQVAESVKVHDSRLQTKHWKCKVRTESQGSVQPWEINTEYEAWSISITSPVSLALTNHIISLVQELRGRQINILEPSPTSLLVHEEQPLIPLYVINRGVPRPSDKQICLCQSPVQPSCTISKIAANRLQFAIPGLCIDTVEGLNYLCIHFVIRQLNLTATFALPGPGQSDDDPDLGLELGDDDDWENLPPSQLVIFPPGRV
ncbi:hypothetical protein DFH09DRAFT_1079603 [Mycena vulgaris]|nr:hypothetical protein DFH09DRAFT_1079603 [Mycena vulgaris]